MSTARRYRYLVQRHGSILVAVGCGGCRGGGGRLLRVLVEAQLLGKVSGQPFCSDRSFGGLSINGNKNVISLIISNISHKCGGYRTAVPGEDNIIN